MPDPTPTTDEEWVEVLQDEIESAEETSDAADEAMFGD